MEFTLEDNILHLKSNCLSNPEVVEFIGQTFPSILNDFFRNENIHSMHDFIVNWKDLKDKFTSFFEMAMFIAIII